MEPNVNPKEEVRTSASCQNKHPFSVVVSKIGDHGEITKIHWAGKWQKASEAKCPICGHKLVIPENATYF